MLPTSRTSLGSIVALVADASLSVLSERVHRGSLTNARLALDERQTADLATQAVLRQLARRPAPAAAPKAQYGT
ncbi:hypothetical protein GCM10009547_48420 [Sporichthya brevicatena]|uniref:Uncharacterized protein n=1 Tax=Sporichthya brevicatena TaxID=171442 RepID=A0ABN1HCS4_9ACTN